jgi:hypothetical protein
MRPFYCLDYLLMAFPACCFCDLPVVRFDTQWIWIFSRSEGEGVPEAIRRLGRIFSYKAGGCMAIIAGRNRAVTRFDPAVVMLAHDVAICACGRVVCQIRGAFCVNKSIAADTGSKTYCDAKNYSCKRGRLHRFSTVSREMVINRREPQRHKGHKEKLKSLCSLCLCGSLLFMTISHTENSRSLI